MTGVAFKPSDVVLIDATPLLGTLGRAEVEQAVALIVRVCQTTGDAWRTVAWPDVQAMLHVAVDTNAPPFAALVRNPFFNPDVRDAVKRGFARWATDDHAAGGVELTEECFQAIAKWAKHPKDST